MSPKLIRAMTIVRRFRSADVGEFKLPPDHLFAMEVPKGGSSCAKCHYVGQDSEHCGNSYFQNWRKSLGHMEDPGLLPKPANEYCCDVFEAK